MLKACAKMWLFNMRAEQHAVFPELCVCLCGTEGCRCVFISCHLIVSIPSTGCWTFLSFFVVVVFFSCVLDSVWLMFHCCSNWKQYRKFGVKLDFILLYDVGLNISSRRASLCIILPTVLWCFKLCLVSACTTGTAWTGFVFKLVEDQGLKLKLKILSILEFC